MKSTVLSGSWIVAAIVAALLVWGTIHVIGVYRASGRPVLAALVVAICFGGFLGFWAVLLAIRRRRR